MTTNLIMPREAKREIIWKSIRALRAMVAMLSIPNRKTGKFLFTAS